MFLKHVYDISFVPKGKGTQKYSSIIFSVPRILLDDIYVRIAKVVDYSDAHAMKYFYRGVPFLIPPDLFGNCDFGYGACALVKTDENGVHIVFELNSHERTEQIALTIHVLLSVLNSFPYNTANPSNREQGVTLHTRCEHVSSGYGHAMGGQLHKEMMFWLQAYAKRCKVHTAWEMERIRLPPGVLSAMRETWKCVSDSENRRWAKDCGGFLAPDGRFALICFGNATDLSIYPDSYRQEQIAIHGAEFSCHNLDSAEQQLTLLAGFAALTNFIRKGIERDRA